MDTGPQYQRIYQDLHDRLAAREWAIGERLPSISQLQQRYDGAALNTVRHAQQLLVDEGYLRTEQGRGAYVVAHPHRDPEPSAAVLAMIDDALQQLTRARRLLSESLR